MRFVLGCVVIVTWAGLPAALVYAQGDGYLNLSANGCAIRPSRDVADLDYTKDFSVEAILKIEANQSGGRWPCIVGKARSDAGYSESEPGFLLGLEQGHLQTYGQIVLAKVGDGTHHVVVKAREREGCVYAVMTWQAGERTLTLHVNGQLEGWASDVRITPSRVKNSASLGLGYNGGDYAPLGRDIQLARLWNRKLSAQEVQSLWDRFALTRQHALASGFDHTALVSEWLMFETSDAQGRTGATHVKDTVGANHLRLQGQATVVIGKGPLTVVAPVPQATEVDKSVYLTVRGGQGSLPGPVTSPLQYYFELDESPQFQTASKRQSGWIAHYGGWSPILKPNTLHYWRVKVRDSSTPPQESAFLPVGTFTTEGPSTWYVRPRDGSRTYGKQDGTSYENAFNGLVNWDNDQGASPGIVWGPDGVEAGDTLYLCDTHVFPLDTAGFADAAMVYIKASGYSQEHPIRIRGDAPGHSGVVIGGDAGYSLKLDRRKYVTFQGITFNGFRLGTETLTPDGQDEAITDQGRSTHIVFDGCTMTDAESFITLYTGHDHWVFRNNTIMNGGSAIKTNGIGGSGAKFLTVERNVIKHLGVAPWEDPDAHAVGGGAGEGHLIQGNYIEDTGTAIEFWTATSVMRNMIVRGNFIKDVKSKRVTEGHGIAISGENNDSFGLRTGFKICGNIILNAEGAGISSNNKDLVEVYDNVIHSCRIGLQFGIMDAPLAAAVFNNIVVDPREFFIHVEADPNVPWPHVSWDHNLYWPVPHPRAVFGTIRTPGGSFSEYRQVLGWDQNGLAADPQFISSFPQSPSDFRLRSTSPAIDAGEKVGIDQDFIGNTVPWGKAPDIGAYEFIGGIRP